MLFNSLEIQRFRAFEYLHIEKLGRINLIVGRNNVGKSTVLEAIRLYANLGAPHVLMEILESRDDRLDREADFRLAATKSLPAIQHLFHGYPSLSKITEPVRIGPFSSPDSTLSIGIEWVRPSVTSDGKEELLPGENPALTPNSESIPSIVLRIGGYTRFIRLDRSMSWHYRRWQFQPKTFLDLSTPCVCVGPHGLSASHQQRIWEAVALSDLEQDVIDSLNIVYPGVDAVAMLPDSDARSGCVRVKHPDFSRPHPLKSLGDGTGRIFGLTLSLVAAQRGILLIDEIENGIHYSVLVELWKFIAKVAKRLDVQVFATSHSLDCIKAFHEVAHADTSVEGVLNRIESRKGVIRSVLFDEDKLDRFLDEGIELR